jgi:hypothetical protein
MQQVWEPERARDPQARGAAAKGIVNELSISLRVSAMRIPLTVTIIAIAMLASPFAYGQASGKGQTGTHGTGGKPSGPLVGGGDSNLIPPKQPAAVAPPSDALRNLAGGGYADPNYVPPTTQSKKSTPHRVTRAPRARTSRGFELYGVDPAFPY